jgi:hypothetical protein
VVRASTRRNRFYNLLNSEVEQDEIFSSSFAASAYLQSIAFTKKVYVIGGPGIAEELTSAGISNRGVDEHARFMTSVEEAKAIEIDPDIGAVVVGLDFSLTYLKIACVFTLEFMGCVQPYVLAFVLSALHSVTYKGIRAAYLLRQIPTIHFRSREDSNYRGEAQWLLLSKLAAAPLLLLLENRISNFWT